MHQFLLELFHCHYHLCLLFIHLFILLYSMVQQLVLPHEEICSKAKALKDFLEILNFLTLGCFIKTCRCMSLSVGQKTREGLSCAPSLTNCRSNN